MEVRDSPISSRLPEENISLLRHFLDNGGEGRLPSYRGDEENLGEQRVVDEHKSRAGEGSR
jgi:hypothetical protein